MNTNKLISILLFLLLLLLIICVWCHTDKIVQKNTLTLSSQSTIETSQEKEKEKLKLLSQEKAQKVEEEIKKIIAFEDINFELNKVTLTEKSINTISQIATVLKANPQVNVKIDGHTDDSGEETHNLNLSQARVDTVKKCLVEMDIAPTRVSAIGYGETKPLVSNDTEENRRINRRVEFKILGE